jgi:hypothetical protein
MSTLAQDTCTTRCLNGPELTLHGGLSYLTVRDEYISRENYTATLPSVGLSWSQFGSRTAYFVAVHYQSTSRLKNYNVSANFSQVSAQGAFLFRAGDFSLLHRNLTLWIGPGSEIFWDDRQQNIAGSVKVSSSLGSMCASFNARIFYQLASWLQLEAGTFVSLLSLTGKSSEGNDSDDSPKVLTLFSSLRTESEVRLRCHVTGSLSAFAAYRFELTRVSAWDRFVAAGDHFIASLSYDF